MRVKVRERVCGGERPQGDGVEEDEKRYGTTRYTSNKVQYSTVLHNATGYNTTHCITCTGLLGSLDRSQAYIRE